MKIKQSLTAIAIGAILIACGGNQPKEVAEENDGTENTSEMDLTAMEETDLSAYELNATIYIPDASQGKPNITLSSFGSVEIMVGEGYGIEIVPFGLTVAEKKEELEGDLVYDIEYIEENANSILFKRTIKDSDIKPEFHFFMTKEINGDLTEIKSMNKAYNEREIEKMMQSAKSLKGKPSA